MFQGTIKLTLATLLLAASSLASAAVNVNTADARLLDKELAGVGATTAQRMVEERKKGEFRDMADLKKRVKGFGDKLAAKNQANIRFKD